MRVETKELDLASAKIVQSRGKNEKRNEKDNNDNNFKPMFRVCVDGYSKDLLRENNYNQTNKRTIYINFFLK